MKYNLIILINDRMNYVYIYILYVCIYIYTAMANDNIKQTQVIPLTFHRFLSFAASPSVIASSIS